MEQTTANGVVLTATKDSVNRSNGLPATTSAQPPPDCPSSCSGAPIVWLLSLQ